MDRGPGVDYPDCTVQRFYLHQSLCPLNFYRSTAGVNFYSTDPLQNHTAPITIDGNRRVYIADFYLAPNDGNSLNFSVTRDLNFQLDLQWTIVSKWWRFHCASRGRRGHRQVSIICFQEKFFPGSGLTGVDNHNFITTCAHRMSRYHILTPTIDDNWSNTAVAYLDSQTTSDNERRSPKLPLSDDCSIQRTNQACLRRLSHRRRNYAETAKGDEQGADCLLHECLSRLVPVISLVRSSPSLAVPLPFLRRRSTYTARLLDRPADCALQSGCRRWCDRLPTVCSQTWSRSQDRFGSAVFEHLGKA